jgi:DNA-directed RNA polymerase II subunit RPB2
MDQITQNDCWTVIASYFDEKGLVSQQLDSYDEFIENTMQDIVDENNSISVVYDDQQVDIEFGQIYLTRPQITESEGATTPLFPSHARLRNLTYSSNLYLEMKRGDDSAKLFIGKVPMMLKSIYCNLNNMSDQELFRNGECPYDQGGYFIINGSEKVLIAQERMATNHVYVFKKAQPAVYSYSCEIRSQAEIGSKLASTIFMKMMSPKVGGSGQPIRSSLPYIKTDIPIIIVFRALGIVADRDILEHICYDFADLEMLDLLKPVFER